MPKKIHKGDPVVHVYPRGSIFGLRDGDFEESCKQIADQIRRHVDDVQCVEIHRSEEAVCEFCGREWTEADDAFNGGCCDKDMENEPQE